jgi:uncharacterized hydrophobic protein (TIGR00271 family)
MLIAPLLRPIQFFAFTIATSHHKKILRSLKNILSSIILVVVISWVVTKIIPLKLETSEILARTVPNILDFFIALTSAFIAFLALLYKEKLSTSIAGVAMAASLLPPLSVVGIEIAYGNYILSWNAFLLFLANIIGIIITGIILFLFFGFTPHQDYDRRKFKQNITVLFLMLSIISIPLFISIINLNDNIKRKQFIYSELNNTIKIMDIDIKRLSGDKKRIIINGNYSKENPKKQIKNFINNYKQTFKEEPEIEFNLIKIEKIIEKN